ncbi:MAG: hypothetical protein GXO10_01285, partial [Crenarchaeota archaeon]|nr:hypothetical protein [Thermoproteota archaeon]
GIVLIGTAILMIAAGVVNLSADASQEAKSAIASHSLFTSPKQVVKSIGTKLLNKYDALKSDPDFLLCVGFFVAGVTCLVMGTRKLGG